MKSQSFLTDDPALLILYSQLRDQTLQTLRGASKVTPYVEWQFVLHNAKLYDRMGCDLLGLDIGISPTPYYSRPSLHQLSNFESSFSLVRNWQFMQRNASMMPSLMTPLKFTRRRSSIVVADIPV